LQVLLFARDLSLGEALKNLDATLRWDPLFQGGTLSSHDHKAAFETRGAGENSLVLYDGSKILSLSAPFISENGDLYFPEAFVASLKNTFDQSIEEDRSRLRIAAIIVDPGHGGKDAGASATHLINGQNVKVVEKDITLKVSRLLHAKLQAAYPDKQVLLTRSGDTYPTLEDRVVIANNVKLRENEAIVFISVHANASFNKNARGFEVWYLSPDYRRDVLPDNSGAPSEIRSIYNAMLEEEYTTESVMMAKSIAGYFSKTFGTSLPSRGIKAEEWFVVRNARMPSVLVELGFVTNKEDALLMTSDASLHKFSDSIYLGITDFITNFEKSGGFISRD
jgi:N-acetylmuramoyl-L-alanine amidase